MRKYLPGLVTLLWIAALIAGAGLTAWLVQEELAAAQQTPADPPPAPSLTPSASPLPPSPTAPPPTAIPATAASAAPQPEVIGYSIAGSPLEVFRFGDGPVEKMIIAGIHGGYEWNTVALADKMISYLEVHPEIIPEEHTLFILRVLNPDGLARSKGFGGRANENNVDLNRNFPTLWQAEWPRPGCWDYIPITGGSGPASEPETRALMLFVKEHDLEGFISYHSAALGIFPGGQPPDPASLALAEALAAVSEYPYPPIDAGCVFTGQLVDWVSAQGIPAVDVELTNHQDTDFEINLALLSVFLDWEYSAQPAP